MIKSRKKSNSKFIAINTTLLFLFSMLWNALVHLVILKEQNDSLRAIHRLDLNDKMWISILVTISISLFFTISYNRFIKNNTLKEALLHSILFAAFISIVVDLNQYVLYSIPLSIILLWIMFGFGEFIVYGIISYKVNKTINC